MRAIEDKWKGAPISRQRKYQLRKEAEGKCTICGKFANGELFCFECREKRRHAGMVKYYLTRA